MIGDRQVLMPQALGGGRHLGQRRAAVRPGRVAVEVATKEMTQGRWRQRRGTRGPQLGQTLGNLPGHRLTDDGDRRLAQPGHGGPGISDVQRLEVVCVEGVQGLGCLAIGADPVGVGSGPLQPEADLSQ